MVKNNNKKLSIKQKNTNLIYAKHNYPSNPTIVGIYGYDIDDNKSIYSLKKDFKIKESWNYFDRFGMSEDVLDDGRKIYIAGEHEYGYDPEFFIYNDVIVEEDDVIIIYGYPKEIFPPTDFHSTLYDKNNNCIWIVGSLGYDSKSIALCKKNFTYILFYFIYYSI